LQEAVVRRYRVAQRKDIPPGTRLRIEVKGVEVLVFNVGGKFFATGNYCPHEEVELDRATLEGLTLTCWEHGYEMRIDTGACITDPALSLPTFRVTVSGEHVYVEV
jgi:nitrite reductase/ring-hydroxylating ferredoxin subunit